MRASALVLLLLPPRVLLLHKIARNAIISVHPSNESKVVAHGKNDAPLHRARLEQGVGLCRRLEGKHAVDLRRKALLVEERKAALHLLRGATNEGSEINN